MSDFVSLNQDENRYNASRGAHLNLKRAEKARVLVNKIPGMAQNMRGLILELYLLLWNLASIEDQICMHVIIRMV